MLYLWIVVVVVLVLGLGVVMVFNSFIFKRNRVSNAWSDIDVQLKRRYDLIPNLVATVKGYQTHESVLFEQVTEARTNAMKQTNVAGKGQAEDSLSGALKSLFAVAEGYPELRASDNFKQLQEQLVALENDIQSARRYYNAAARELNTAVQVFPASLVAKLFNFKPAEFFGLEAGEGGAVNVDF